MSVNGRPFRPDPYSFRETGTQPGDALRYYCKGVIRTTRDPSIPWKELTIGKPVPHEETEADRELKRLLQKQMESNVSIFRDKRQDFESSTVIESTSEDVGGVLSLDEWKKAEKLKQRRSELESLGLSQEQIAMKLAEEGLAPLPASTVKRNVGPNPDYIKFQIESMEKTLNKRMSEQPSTPGDYEVTVSKKIKSGDVPEPNTASTAAPSPETRPVIPPDLKPVPDGVIQANRATEEEIKGIDPKYSPGEVSRTLFVKNLPKDMTESELASLFLRYNDPTAPLHFKVLTGKMKGKAFITFPDAATAAAALNFIHGYKLKGKPILLQFGKSVD